MQNYHPVTAGERLFHYIYTKFDTDRCWSMVSQALRPLGQAEPFAAYLKQHISLFLCCKLITAGKAVSPPRSASNTATLQYLLDRAPWRSLNDGGRLLRALGDAIKYSDTDISSGTVRELKRFALEKHPHCYLCGITLDLDGEGRDRFTLDHLWPRCYGGESDVQNLLPACGDCNEKKGGRALWVASDIHSVFFEGGETEHAFRALRSDQRIVLYHRAAINLAGSRSMSLKKACLTLGPWVNVVVYEPDEVADMFNLRTHSDENLYSDEIL